MKRLKTSDITTLIGFIPKSGTWDFLQDAYIECFSDIMYNLIKSKNSNFSSFTPYVLYGCELTSILGTTSISGGAFFYNGEIYRLISSSFATPVGPNVVIVNATQTQYGVNADPVTFTDFVPRNVHDIRTAQATSGLTGTGTFFDYTSFDFSIIQKTVENRSNFNGDTIDFTQDRTIFYDTTISGTATPSVTLNLTNAIVGVRIKLTFTPNNSTSIAVTSITESVGIKIIDKTQNLLPTGLCYQCYVEYEYIGENILSGVSFVTRTINGIN